MKQLIGKLIFVFCLLGTIPSNATHLIGGFFSYECVGPVTGTNQVEYILRGIFFRDSSNVASVGSGAILESPLPATLFNQTTGTNRVIQMTQDSLVLFIDSAQNICVVSSTPTIIQKGYYSFRIRLERNESYTLSWRRCCRNNPVNIPDPAMTGVRSGSTFSIDIPAFNQVGRCNSSPELKTEQPFSFCAGVNINLDLSATDANNDSLVYELCAPLDFPSVLPGPGSPSGGAVVQIPASPPPYPSITFLAPNTATNPIPSNPALSINSQTGLLTGSPTAIGKFAVGFCIKEYDRTTKQLLTTTVRDIQVQINPCILQLTSLIQEQEQFCDGLSVQFRNRTSSNVDSTLIPYKWDFGVTTSLADTSRDREPLFTFPAPGTYTITLIANPDNPDCRDTNTKVFVLLPLLDPILSSTSINLCDDDNEVDFNVIGAVQSNATFRWDFGSVASITSSTNRMVNGVSFPSQGTFPIQLIVDQDNCSDTSNTSIVVVDNPSVDFSVNETEGCSPHSVQFTSTPIIMGNGTASYEWDFGDGSPVTVQNSLQNPTHVYAADGSYTVSLVMRTQGDCQDTVTEIKPNFVRVGSQFSNNSVGFTYSDSAGCYPFPVQFTNASNFSGGATFKWSFGDGTSSTMINPLHTYTANGYYDVGLEMITTSGCIDTLTLVIDSAIYVSLDSSNNEVGFIVDQNTGCAPVEIRFTDTSIFEGAAQFKWFFGDGDSSSLQNPVHVYEKDGFFDVQLILTTSEKCVDTISVTKPSLIETDLRFSDNVIDFDFFPKEGCPPLTVQFSDSSFARGNIEYYWDFADGNLSNDQNPTNVYTDSGMYNVSLLITTSGRCKDTLNKFSGETIRVLPQPLARINASDSALPLKKAMFDFNNAGSEFVVSSKYLINGVEVAQSDVLNYQFTDTGHFQVSYVATNSFGCDDTSSAEVFIFDEFEFIIPNVFTPNGDGINDQFKMQACGVYEYEIEIYNRYGESIFRSNSLNINWDGRVAGKLANSGMFFYSIRIKDFRSDFLNYNGSVLLLRD